MEQSYTKSFLNTTLARWLATPLSVPDVDCRGCAKLTKCCAFQPFIPNFLLGGWLESLTVLPQHKSLCFQPLGAMPTPEYREKHRVAGNKDQALDLLCSFYVDGRCSIWNFRPGECSTYFCDEAMTSEPRQSLAKKSFAIEIAVAQMALVELGFAPKEISAQVDACNGQAEFSEKYPDAELILMYKRAWQWSKQLNADLVASWLI
jgi:hypothetical protein